MGEALSQPSQPWEAAQQQAGLGGRCRGVQGQLCVSVDALPCERQTGQQRFDWLESCAGSRRREWLLGWVWFWWVSGLSPPDFQHVIWGQAAGAACPADHPLLALARPCTPGPGPSRPQKLEDRPHIGVGPAPQQRQQPWGGHGGCPSPCCQQHLARFFLRHGGGDGAAPHPRPIWGRSLGDPGSDRRPGHGDGVRMYGRCTDRTD